MNLYEGMFLLDNQVVRTDWAKAKSLVVDAVTKYGGTVETARRWDERKLCYPIAGKKRATYVLCYFNLGIEGIAGIRRDFELSESVLRYMLLRVEEVPEGEAEKSAEENSESFSFPAPPEDDEPEPEAVPAPEKEAAPEQEPAAEKPSDAEAPAASGSEAKPESGAESAEESTDKPDAPSEKVEA